MKKNGWFGVAAVVFLCTGCVYGNSIGGGLSMDELKEVKNDLVNAKEEIEQGMSEAMQEVDEELGSIDWAEALFGTSYGEDPKPKRIMKAAAGDEETLTEAGPVEDFVETADVKSWTKKESLPEGLKEERIYYLQQEATITAVQELTGRHYSAGDYYSIGKLVLYQDSDYVTVVFMEDLEKKTLGIVPKEYLTSVYQVPEEIIEKLKE